MTAVLRPTVVLSLFLPEDKGDGQHQLDASDSPQRRLHSA